MPLSPIRDQLKRKSSTNDNINFIAALSEIFKNIANPQGNLQGSIQHFSGMLIGFVINMFGGIFAKLFGGAPEQVQDLANSAKEAFNRHMSQANTVEAQALARRQKPVQTPENEIPEATVSADMFSSIASSEAEGRFEVESEAPEVTVSAMTPAFDAALQAASSLINQPPSASTAVQHNVPKIPNCTIS